jgi:hypothetical protein
MSVNMFQKLRNLILNAGCWWPTPMILAIQVAEIRRITVQSQPEQIVCEILTILKIKG